VSGQHSANSVEYGPDIGQEGDNVPIVVGLTDVGTPIEDSADLSENVFQEHQFRRQAVLIAQSSGPVHQCGKCSLFIGGVMVGPRLELQVGMCGFAVYSMAYSPFAETRESS
jgi:hypothetical protein